MFDIYTQRLLIYEGLCNRGFCQSSLRGRRNRGRGRGARKPRKNEGDWGKKQVIEIGGDEREISPGKVNLRKTLFSQARDNSRLDSTSTEITSVCILPEQEADDILTSLCNVEDHG